MLAATLLAGCGDAASGTRAPGSLTIATLHLDGWRTLDRDGDGAADDPKPEDARREVLAQLAGLKADVLAVQDIGDDGDVQALRQALAAAGLDYPACVALPAGARGGHALLSRAPGTTLLVHTGMAYRIGQRDIPVDPAFIEAVIRPATNAPAVRVLAAFLAPGEADARSPDTYEIRRNEARLLGQEVRRLATEFPADTLAVAGCLNDSPKSAVLRSITAWREDKGHLADSGARDDHGEAWTCKDESDGEYQRTDYLLLNPAGMARLAPGAARIQTGLERTNPRRAVSVTLSP
ncbi:MAG: hypothetical protein U1F87_19275 [Kiritimatiellia bacterium]